MEQSEEKSDQIRLDEKTFKDFYDHFGSGSFQMQSKVMEDLGSKQIDIYFKSIGFATTVIGAIGLIAGFGFTAFDHIQSTLLFFTGEILLFGALFYGLFWTQSKYQDEFTALEKEQNKLSKFYEGRNEQFLKIYNGYMSNHTISKEELKKLNDIDMGSINLFKSEGNKPAPLIYSKTMYILLIIGTVALISSFFVYSALYTVFCLLF